MTIMSMTKAAKMLGITTKTLRGWIDRGAINGKVLPYSGLSKRRYLIDEATVDDYLRGTKGEHASVNELMAMDTQKSNETVLSGLAAYQNEIVSLRTSVMEQFNQDKRNNPDDRINAVMRDQEALNNKINDRFSVFEEQLQSIAKILTKITQLPPPEPVQRAKQTPDIPDWRKH